jgi:hypothetical protein
VKPQHQQHQHVKAQLSSISTSWFVSNCKDIDCMQYCSFKGPPAAAERLQEQQSHLKMGQRLSSRSLASSSTTGTSTISSI